MKKAYMYTRVSTVMQIENFSLEAQRSKILKMAAAEDIKIVREYSDEGHSGKNISGRPAFQQMLADIESKKDGVDYVMVFKLSRFGRNAADSMNSLQLLRDNDVILYCCEDHLVTDGPYSNFMFNVMAAMAELERENILVQTMAGRKQKASTGAWNGGFAPYGYDLVDSKLQIREDEAVVIREIFKLYVETNLGSNGVAKKINELFKKNSRKTGYLRRFSSDFVKGVIRNPVYKGTISFGRRHTAPVDGKKNEYHVILQTDESQIVFAKGQHEAIVPEELWNLANEKLKSMGGRKEKIDKDHEYILSGLVKCPDCGAPMYGIPNGTKKNKWGETYRTSYSYKCRNQSRESGHVCPSHTQFSASKLDAAVRDIIVDMVSDENFKARIDELIGSHVDEDNIRDQIEQQEKELRRINLLISRIEAQLNRIDYEDENAYRLEESLNTRLNTALSDSAATERSIFELNQRLIDAGNESCARDSVYDLLTMFSEVYDLLTDKEKKNLMQAIISKIELYPKNGKAKGGQWIKAIYFKLPLSYHGKIVEDIQFDEEGQIFRPNQSTDETVCLLSKLSEAKHHISIQVDMDELDLTSAESKATYEEIQEWVQEKYGLHVTHLNIAQVKRKHGIIERENYNKPKSPDSRQPGCPEEKVIAIEAALKHFQMI